MKAYFTARSGLVSLVALMVFGQANFVNGEDLYLNEHCGRTIDIGQSGGTLKSQSGLIYSNNVDCAVSLEATSFVQRILLTFISVGIDGAASCTEGDVLEIYDGLSTDDESHKLQTICGSSSEDQGLPAEITSSLNHITLKFTTDNVTQDSGFRIAYTAFSLGTCRSSEFKCQNGRCIDQALENNLWDNCGDDSDELGDLVETVTGLLRWGIAIFIIILVAIVVVVILLCVCCGCLCYHCCCKSKPPPQTTMVMSSADPKHGAQYA